MAEFAAILAEFGRTGDPMAARKINWPYGRKPPKIGRMFTIEEPVALPVLEFGVKAN